MRRRFGATAQTLIAPFAFGAILAPGAFGAVLAPGAFGAILAPGAFGAILAPGAFGAILAPGAFGAVLAPGASAERDRLQSKDPLAGIERIQGAASSLRQASRAALERGLEWLAAEQAKSPDGSIGVARAKDPAPVAVTALASLAWMAAGSTPERGPQGKELAVAIDWLALHVELDPAARTPGFVGLQGDRVSRMHGHGFATLALASAWGMSPRTARGERIERALRGAVACIQSSQGVEGGWWYEPRKSLEHEGSITICAVQALRAAHGAGVKVDPLVIARAVDYVGRLQKADGSFRYSLTDEWSTPALTAAGIATLNASGTYDGKPIEEGYGFLLRRLALREAERTTEHPRGDPRLPAEIDEKHVYCPFYERLCVAQALWQSPDRALFEDWSARESALALTRQRADGSWEDRRFGDAYATAMTCLFLALPEELLPIFQR